MKSFVLAIGLTGLFFNLQAQDRVLPGYIVKYPGDTLRGILKEQGGDESSKQISFKASATDKDYQIYTPEQVKSYQYDSGNLFRAITYADDRPGPDTRTGSVSRTCYGKLLLTGEYDLYSFTEEGALYFLVRKDNNFILMYDDDLQTMTGVKGNFRSELNFFASGCDAMSKEVESAGYSVSGLMAFFQQLDACLNPNKSVQSYYHEVKGYSGFFADMGGIAYGSRAQFTVEAGWRRVWPQVTPNFSLNIGLRFANLVKLVETTTFPAKIYTRADYQITSVPVTIQYNLSLLKGRVQPFVFAGLSLVTVNVQSDSTLPDNGPAKGFVLGLGIEVKITHLLWARAEWREEYMSQFPTVGLAVILP
jgi:hypothetical protein